MRILIRDSLASLFRVLPPLRGKNRIGLPLIHLLTNYQVEKECIVTLKMRDGSLMQIDLRSFEEKVFLTGEYDFGIIQRLSNILEPGCTIFDVGANIGFYSIALGRKLKNVSGSKIWAIEAVQSNFNRLTRMVELNELKDIISPVNIALGNMQGEVLFHMTDEGKSSTGNAIWVKEGIPHSRQPHTKAYMTRLDDFTKENNINKCDLIKVDIEGAELDFILGGTNFINKTLPLIFSEFNPDITKEFGYSFTDFSQLMKSYKYNLYRQQGLKNFVPIEKNLTRLSNIIMIPQVKSNKTLLEQLGIVSS